MSGVAMPIFREDRQTLIKDDAQDKRKLRIAIFHATLPQVGKKLGGVEVTVHRLANALVQHRGNNVTVFSCSNKVDDALYRQVRVSSDRVGKSKLLRLFWLPTLLNSVDFSEFDVLHLHGDDWFFFRRRLPTVRTFHGSALLEARSAQSLKRKLFQYVVYPLELLASRLATMSVGVGPEALRIYNASDLANNGVDLTVFKPRPKDTRPLLFYIGTWNGRKRGKFAFETFVTHILPRYPDAMLYMACDAVPDHPQVIKGGFPPQSVIAEWMARAWVFLYPSLYEGFGIPYIEALACGTAIVTTFNDGSDYVLDHGRYGIISSDTKFGEEVNALLGKDEIRKGLEVSGLLRAANFSWQIVSEQHLAMYTKAIAK